MTNRDKIIAAANGLSYEDTDIDGNPFSAMPDSCWGKFYDLAFAAGAASRDAEIAELVAALEYWEAIYKDKYATSFEGPSIVGKSALAKVRKP